MEITITNKRINDRGQLVFTVLFTTAERTISKDYFFFPPFDETRLKVAVKEDAERLEAAEAVTTTTGTIDLTGVVTKVEPSADEVAKQEWFRNWNRLQQVQILISHGVLTGNEKPVTDLRAKVAADFRAVYINDM